MAPNACQNGCKFAWRELSQGIHSPSDAAELLSAPSRRTSRWANCWTPNSNSFASLPGATQKVRYVSTKGSQTSQSSFQVQVTQHYRCRECVQLCSPSS